MADQQQPGSEIGGGPSYRTSSASRGSRAGWSGGTTEPPPLLQRALLLPFSPALWRAAPSWRLGQVIAPLVILSLVAGFALGAVRGVELRSWVVTAGAEYDARFDRVVVEDGQVRVDGERLPRWTEGRTTYLVDPEEKVALGDLKTPEYFVVRRTVVIRHEAFRDQSFPVAQAMKLIGIDRLVVDGASIRRLGERWGIWLGLLGMAVMGFFGFLADLIGCPLYALAAAGILVLLRRQAFADGFATAFRVGLATSSLSILGSLVPRLLELPTPCCLTLLLWPVLMAVLALLAIGDRKLTGPR